MRGLPLSYGHTNPQAHRDANTAPYAHAKTNCYTHAPSHH